MEEDLCPRPPLDQQNNCIRCIHHKGVVGQQTNGGADDGYLYLVLGAVWVRPTDVRDTAPLATLPKHTLFSE